MNAIDTAMAALKRTKESIDMLEHTMQGVRTSENRGQIVSFHADPGILGRRSRIKVRAFADTPVEREVTVKMTRVIDRRRR